MSNNVSNAIKINFDVAHNPEEPTFILAKKNGDKLGKINATAIELTSNMNDADEISFSVYKYIDNEKDPLWDSITNFKLVYCPEWSKYKDEAWFEITVELDESLETKKTVFATQLGHAELGQIMLYDIAINTDGDDGDIARDDYIIPTVLYREDEYDVTKSDKKFYKEVYKKDIELPFADYKGASLLHRILKDKAPHYSVAHVDDTIKYMQRTFEFSDTSIFDALQEIAEEIGCLFTFGAYMDEYVDKNGNIKTILRRTISVYDLESNCKSCGHRGEFVDICPECERTDIDDGYGEDTTIFVTADEIADDIQLTTDTDAMKNCFKLEGGDDLMTATIKNCNPSGSDRIFYISQSMKADMSDDLVAKIDAYNQLYEDYQTGEIELDESLLQQYNDLVNKYNELMNKSDDDKLELIETPIEGFPALIDAYYNTFDMYLYLQSGLMPTIDAARPSIEDEIVELTAANLSPVAVNITSTSSNPLKAASVSTVDNLVLQMAKTLVDSRYKVKIADGSTLGFYVDGEYLIDNAENKSKYEDGMLKYWRGNFVLTAYSDDEMTAATNDNDPTYYVEVEVNDDYETFVRRKLDKALSTNDVEDMSISGLFAKDLAVNFTTSDGSQFKDADENDFVVGASTEESFQYALKQYSLNRLLSFQDACQSCIDIMIEMGVADGETWGNVENANLYEDLYMPYYNKLAAINEEIAVRDAEIAIIAGVYDEDGNLVSDGLQTIIEKKKAEIQDALDFEKFLREDEEYPNGELWFEFCSFRREDKYSNDNYISDGKNNAEIISLANEFLETAKKEIYKSAELQCSISASLKNLLVIEKFKPLVDKFRVGNWLRVMVDDKVYKLRLISYTIDYDSLDGISVEFSDTVKANSTIKGIQEVLDQASSMATSYSATQRQASKGEESSSVINDWFSSGLDATNVKIIGGADGQSQSWDNHGMLFREYDDTTGEYSPEQLKIVNSTMAITTDNWKSTKTAVGKYYYTDPVTNEAKLAYGINAETVIGKFILGENMSIQNESGSMVFNESGLTIASGTDDDKGTMTFDENGLEVKHGDENYVKISPSTSEIMNIVYNSEEVFEVNDGGLTINGNIMARSLTLGNNVTIDSDVITVKTDSGDIVGLSAVAGSGSYNDLVDTPNLAAVATSGSYTDLIDQDELAKVSDLSSYAKADEIPTVPTTATSVTSSGTNPVSGGAVYNYAVAKNQGTSNAGKLLYIDEDGSVTTLTIASLKTLLGIE